jgi:hypothetical protein
MFARGDVKIAAIDAAVSKNEEWPRGGHPKDKKSNGRNE